jgi:hypothetical protein
MVRRAVHYAIFIVIECVRVVCAAGTGVIRTVKKKTRKATNKLERLTGIDLDGDGDVGKVEAQMAAQKGNETYLRVYVNDKLVSTSPKIPGNDKHVCVIRDSFDIVVLVLYFSNVIFASPDRTGILVGCVKRWWIYPELPKSAVK